MKLLAGFVPLAVTSYKCSTLCDGGTATLDNCSSNHCQITCNVEPCSVYSGWDFTLNNSLRKKQIIQYKNPIMPSHPFLKIPTWKIYLIGLAMEDVRSNRLKMATKKMAFTFCHVRTIIRDRHKVLMEPHWQRRRTWAKCLSRRKLSSRLKWCSDRVWKLMVPKRTNRLVQFKVRTINGRS